MNTVTLHSNYRIADNTAMRESLWIYLTGAVPLNDGLSDPVNVAAVEAALAIIVSQRANNDIDIEESWRLRR